MNAQRHGSSAFGGGALMGDHLVRMAYLDESGISNPRQEPFVVVAGPIIHADKQWLAVERHLEHLADKYAPPDQREDFAFHATDLFSGGKFFPRDKWDREARWTILDELVQIPIKFGLPISLGSVRRSDVSALNPDLSPGEIEVMSQTMAFMICAAGIELYMNHSPDVARNEVVAIVLENNDKVKQSIKEIQHVLRNPRNAERLKKSRGGSDFTLTRVIDTPHFAEKGQSSPHQIADVCAFVIKRHRMQTPESSRFYEPLRPRLVLIDKDDIRHGEPKIPIFTGKS